MGNELVAPVLGLVGVCLIGIIFGAFLISWLKEVIRSQKQASDPYSNTYQTAPNIYQCRTCANKIIDLDPSLPDRQDKLPTTSRAGQSEYRNPALINKNDHRGNPNENKMYRSKSHETLLNIAPGSPSQPGNNAPTFTGTGIRRSLSCSDLNSSSPNSTNDDYPGTKNKLYAETEKSSSIDQSLHPANKMYYDHKNQDSISYVYEPGQVTILKGNSPTSYGGNKQAMEMANRSELGEQGSCEGRVPAAYAYDAHVLPTYDESIKGFQPINNKTVQHPH